MISLSRGGTSAQLTQADRVRLTREWQQRHHLVLPRFFHDTLLGEIRREIGTPVFTPEGYEVGHEQLFPEGSLVRLLDFLMNDPPLLDAVRELTGCETIGRFHGRIYRLTPGTDEGHTWHSDWVEGRRIAVTVNLSAAAYEGGRLQMRRSATHELLADVANHGEGDALLFRLAPGLEHQVQRVAGAVPRIAYAGWFSDGPSLRDQLSSMAVTAGPK